MKSSLIVLHAALSISQPPLRALAGVLGAARIADMQDDLSEKMGRECQRVVVCAPFTGAADVLAWLAAHRSALQDVPALSFVEIASQDEPDSWLIEAQARLPLSRDPHLSARIPADDVPAAVDFALALKSAENQPSGQISTNEVKTHVEHFLRQHNTCTLSTCQQGQVHATPLEYRYQDGHVYLVSEGGEKLAALFLNPRLALCVYEPYQGFAHLAGAQLSGVANLPEPADAAYANGLAAFGLSKANIQAMPFLMHVIDVRLTRAVFLWSGFKDLGCNTRQVYFFA